MDDRKKGEHNNSLIEIKNILQTKTQTSNKIETE